MPSSSSEIAFSSISCSTFSSICGSSIESLSISDFGSAKSSDPSSACVISAEFRMSVISLPESAIVLSPSSLPKNPSESSSCAAKSCGMSCAAVAG